MYTCCIIVKKNANLWEGVVALLNDLCILGLLPDNNTLTGRQKLWIRLATITGCRIILRHWKSSTLCCFKEWTEQMTESLTEGREDIFNQVWGSFLMSIEGLSVCI